MSRIPALPYRVLIHRKPITLAVEQHSYANLAGAIAYRDIALRRRNTRKGEVVLVLDESMPTNDHPS